MQCFTGALLGQTLNPAGYRHGINLSYRVQLRVSHQLHGSTVLLSTLPGLG